MFCKQLKTIRTASGKTQKELAEFLNISPQSVSKWELGESLPSIEYIPLMARFLGCSTNAFFTDIEVDCISDICAENTEDALALEEKVNTAMRHFKLNAEVRRIYVGKRITTVTIEMMDGVGLSDVMSRADDILYLIGEEDGVIKKNVENTFVIEIPNKKFTYAPLADALSSKEYADFNGVMPFIVGYDTADRLVIEDFVKLPHLLLTGKTGCGKTVFIRNVIAALAYRLTPDDMRFVVLDPKRCEYRYLNTLPHLMWDVATSVELSVRALDSLVELMLDRIALLKARGTRDIAEYNLTAAEKMPRILLVVDELLDLVLFNDEVENLILDLCMKGRRVGIHVLISSQICNDMMLSPAIRANIPSRATMHLDEIEDSLKIIDTDGAEKLSDRGDMLYKSLFLKNAARVQVPFIDESDFFDIIAK